jgi:hypothetical protein|tara:strand:- start:1741 stop:2031 length:291 start_codon:yes stop_codon:yes gene_type:complete
MFRHKNPSRPSNLEQQMKIKKFDPIELKAWNSLYPDIKFKEKKTDSKKVFDGVVQEDPPKKPKPKPKYDIDKEQKPKPHKKPKLKNPKVFQEKKKK